METYSRYARPFGVGWEKWIERWWRWCYYDPLGTSPVADTTGELCSKGQTDENVWFLAGTFGGTAIRNCSMPAGKAIFFPVVNDLVSFYTDTHLKTEAELFSYARADLDHVTFLQVKVDGMEIQDLESFRSCSSIFQISLPNKNGRSSFITTEAVSDGYWMFLKPVGHGQHIVEFAGEKLEFDQFESGKQMMTEVPKFRVQVYYLLTVI